jgi:hypothetical protein
VPTAEDVRLLAALLGEGLPSPVEVVLPEAARRVPRAGTAVARMRAQTFEASDDAVSGTGMDVEVGYPIPAGRLWRTSWADRYAVAPVLLLGAGTRSARSADWSDDSSALAAAFAWGAGLDVTALALGRGRAWLQARFAPRRRWEGAAAASGTYSRSWSLPLGLDVRWTHVAVGGSLGLEVGRYSLPHSAGDAGFVGTTMGLDVTWHSVREVR